MRELAERGLVTRERTSATQGCWEPWDAPGVELDGAVVDLDKIPKPEGMEMLSWQKMYPGMGFVVTAPPAKAEEVVRIFRVRGLNSAVIGRVTGERRLVIESSSEKAVLFDFVAETITGIR
jgi:selenophosphate synthetase-related protein